MASALLQLLSLTFLCYNSYVKHKWLLAKVMMDGLDLHQPFQFQDSNKNSLFFISHISSNCFHSPSSESTHIF